MAAPSWSWMVVRAIHILFIVWMIYAPFSGREDMLVLHAIVAPFLMLHWILSDAGCILTQIEKYLRGLDHESESFIHSIVAPIYVIDDRSLKPCIFGSTIVLWLITLSQLDREMVARVFTKTDTASSAMPERRPLGPSVDTASIVASSV